MCGGKQDLWYRYFKDDIPLASGADSPSTTYDIQAIEAIFLAYVQNVSNPTVKEKIRKFSNQYLREHYLKLLSGKKWSLRMNALYQDH
ncbi:MAG: hypothetical protein ACOX4A_08530 [Saccharofermentanales bacterium]